MRWVKLTLPRPEREREPLMTLRLTSSSLAGTFRKLVAVGTSRLASMFLTITAPTPLISSPSPDAEPVGELFGALGAGSGAGAEAGAGAGAEFATTAGSAGRAGSAGGGGC